MRQKEVGTIVFGAISPREGIQFDINDYGGIIRIYFDSPTAEEIEQINSEDAIKMGALELKDALYILIKFGSLNWMDAPFNIHLSSMLTEKSELGEIDELPVYVELYDRCKGRLEAINRLRLNRELTMQIKKAAEQQLKKTFERSSYDADILQTYRKYSTKDMVKMAPRIYSIPKEHNASQTMEKIMGKCDSDIRESIADLVLCGCARRGNFKGLPEELVPFNYWIVDSGNVIMGIPECLLEKAIQHGNLMDYECGIPCSYVLGNGYRMVDGHVVVDVPYSYERGLGVDHWDW